MHFECYIMSIYLTMRRNGKGVVYKNLHHGLENMKIGWSRFPSAYPSHK